MPNPYHIGNPDLIPPPDEGQITKLTYSQSNSDHLLAPADEGQMLKATYSQRNSHNLIPASGS